MQISDATQTEQFALAVALERLAAWLREHRAPGGLTATALTTLLRLRDSGPLRVTDLASLEGLTQPGMTVLINRLVNGELAVRETDPDDGRAVRVRITELGKEQVGAYERARIDLISARVLELPATDQRVLLNALSALQNFTSNPGDAARASRQRPYQRMREGS
jgi:DNA-binding MarR family transcriptional regulator